MAVGFDLGGIRRDAAVDAAPDPAVQAVMAVEFVPAAGERVFAIQTVRGPIVTVREPVAVSAGAVGIPSMIDFASEAVKARILVGTYHGTAACSAGRASQFSPLLSVPIRVHAAKDRAVIIVTHDNRIFSFADRVAYMADGKINQVESGETLSKS